MPRVLICICVFAVGLFASAGILKANDEQEPLHQQIDKLIESHSPGFNNVASPVCTDSTFLRRVTLDLTAGVPTAAQARQFMSEKGDVQAKRLKAVEGLLASPAYARRMQYFLDWILMERRTSQNVKASDWQQYLYQAASENRSWDQLAREILADGGGDPKTRARARFYLDREFDLVVVTRDVGRIFLGKDLECAQCHNHPAVDAYLQRHYHGLKAFLGRSYLFTDPKSKQKSLGEKAEGDVTFTSAFDDSEGKTSPRVLDLPEIVDPDGTLKKYVTKPSKTARGVPKYSRRGQLGTAVTATGNRAFRENIANRLWAMMMGRGLVEPLDLSHDANPASHPQLLALMADALHEHQYDMKWFLRELAQTRTYQRSSIVTGSDPPASNRQFGVGLLKPLSPEQFAWATMRATGFLATVEASELKKLKSTKDKQPQKSSAEDGKPAAAGTTVTGKNPTAVEVDRAVSAAVESHVKTFVTQFAADGGQRTSFSATAPQALFLVNGGLVREWLKPNGRNLIGRLAMMDDSAAIAEELYMHIFHRPPTDLERREVGEYLAGVTATDPGSGSRLAALQELASALLLSAEFRFNH